MYSRDCAWGMGAGRGDKGTMPETERSRAWLHHCLRSQPCTNSLDQALHESLLFIGTSIHLSTTWPFEFHYSWRIVVPCNSLQADTVWSQLTWRYDCDWSRKHLLRTDMSCLNGNTPTGPNWQRYPQAIKRYPCSLEMSHHLSIHMWIRTACMHTRVIMCVCVFMRLGTWAHEESPMRQQALQEKWKIKWLAFTYMCAGLRKKIQKSPALRGSRRLK